MIHHYFDVDFEIIGEVFAQDLDVLGDTVRLIDAAGIGVAF